MKLLEKILISIFVLALILKVVHLPFTNHFLVLSCGVLAFFYLFIRVKFNLKNIEGVKKKNNFSDNLINNIIGPSLSLCITVILFRMQLWGNSIDLMAFVFAFFTLVFLFLSKTIENKKMWFKRIGLIYGMALILFFLNPKVLLKIYYPNNPDYTNAVFNEWDDPENQELIDKVQEEREKMNNGNRVN